MMTATMLMAVRQYFMYLIDSTHTCTSMSTMNALLIALSGDITQMQPQPALPLIRKVDVSLTT